MIFIMQEIFKKVDFITGIGDGYYNASTFYKAKFHSFPSTFTWSDWYLKDEIHKLVQELKHNEVIVIDSKVKDDEFQYEKITYFDENLRSFIELSFDNSLSDAYNLEWNIAYNPKDLKEDEILNFKKRFDDIQITAEVSKGKIHLIKQEFDSLVLTPFEIKIPKIEDLDMSYGKGFKEKHEHLLSKLILNDEELGKGVALFHGVPGSGKTTYIKYLISILANEDRTIIYIPKDMIPIILTPSFLPLILDHPNSILIIEDADEAVKSRDDGGSMVDQILNISDGILSDILGAQIICTFNTSEMNIDEALIRKGRLIFKHKFDALEVDDAQKLSDSLNFSTIISSEMTLAEIYNQEDPDYKQDKQKRMGFI